MGRVGRSMKNRHVTKSGKTIKVHHSLVERFVSKRESKLRRRADRMNDLPKNKYLRFLTRLHPKRVTRYWFSRDGAIMAMKIFGIGAVASFLILVGLFAYFRKDLPNLRDIAGNNIGGSIRYFDKTGQTLLWEDYDAVKRIPVKDEEISPFIKLATVAVEDKYFFKHGGFDVRGIIRAGWNNAVGSGGTQGGSTITQQLVKLTLNWSKERTVSRKIKELILSVELERNYSKKEILTGYLNTAPYGGVDYGAEAAARDYFDKPAKDLTLDESALLAAIPKYPGLYYPYSPNFNKDELIGRQHYIINLMEEQGMIKAEQRDEAKKIDTLGKLKPRKPKYAGIKAPWFVLAAKYQVQERCVKTVNCGGWKVITTLDMEMQKIAEEEVSKGLAQVKRQGGDTAAFVAEDVKTGQVVALVGGADFSNPDFGQNNYAHDLKLPPGSSFKPYDYTAVMESTNTFGAGTVLYDTLGPLPGHYPCTTGPKKGGNCLVDYDFRFPGPLSVRYALGGSRNVPAVKAMLIAGIDKTIDTASKLMDQNLADGVQKAYNCYEDDELTKEAPCYASSAIGDGAYLKLDQHVHGFASLSRNGRNIPQTYILKIEDAANKTVDEWKPTQGEQVVREDTAYIISDILSDPNASYFSRKLHRYKDWKFSLKTGTTNDAKDGLLMGYSTNYAAGVWVGYHNRRVQMRGFMETMTQPIWNGFMTRVHDKIKAEERVRPKGVQTLPAYVVKTHVGVGSVEPSPANDLYPSWYQKPSKTTSSKRTIDIVSNKLATDCTPDRAKKEVNDTEAENFSGDTFHAAGGDTSDKDDIHKCDDVKPAISISGAPASCSDSCTISVNISQGTHPLSSATFPGTVNIIIDGQIVQAFNADTPGSRSLTFSYSGDGTNSVTAEIIDSVLYSGSSNAVSISFSGGGESGGGGGGGGEDLQAISPANGTTVLRRNAVVFNWNSLGSGVSYTVFWTCPGKNKSESVGSATNYNPPDNDVSVGSCTWRVTSSNGKTSPTNTFTILAP